MLSCSLKWMSRKWASHRRARIVFAFNANVDSDFWFSLLSQSQICQIKKNYFRFDLHFEQSISSPIPCQIVHVDVLIVIVIASVQAIVILLAVIDASISYVLIAEKCVWAESMIAVSQSLSSTIHSSFAHQFEQNCYHRHFETEYQMRSENLSISNATQLNSPHTPLPVSRSGIADSVTSLNFLRRESNVDAVINKDTRIAYSVDST